MCANAETDAPCLERRRPREVLLLKRNNMKLWKVSFSKPCDIVAENGEACLLSDFIV